MHAPRSVRTVLGTAALTLAVAGVWPARDAAAVDPGSQPIGCDQADQRITLTASAHLDPSCTWTRGVEIVASDVVLDCQGAHIAAPDRRYGILISAPTDVALSNITVRNCHVEGFLNNFHIERDGFRDLAAGVEYEHAFSNILIEDSTSLDSRGVGIFVDGYVTGVTLRNLHVEGAGSAGIYLEAGSKDNVVESNEIVHNGYKENGPDGQYFDNSNIFFWGPGREGLAMDGSRNNRIANNVFSGNSAGAIFLYKNCGEFAVDRPERWFERRYGADGNLIEGNTIVGEKNGVWIASRMGENTFPMECSDPAYIDAPIQRVSLDYADDNVVRANVFQNVTYGVRVEDDHAVVTDNDFTGDDPAEQAIIVGTRFRTPVLALPVDGTTISDNRATIAGNVSPYRWVHGHTNTTFANNRSHGRLAGFCEGVQPPMSFFIFAIAFTTGTPPDPPVVDPPVVPAPEPVPPCPLACDVAGSVLEGRIAIRRLDTPPGDDTLSFRGQVTLPHPFDPALDPVAVGVGVLLTDTAGNRLVDLVVPGGAYDRASHVGWKASPSRGVWKYANGSAHPADGITGVAVKDLSRKTPGLVQFTVKGRRGSFPVDPANLPLDGLFVVDPPTAETGQCGHASFLAPPSGCASDGRAVRCR